MANYEKTSIARWIATLSSIKHDDKHIKVSKTLLSNAMKPRRVRVTVNLKKLNMYANDSDNIIVPGKVLATGIVEKKFNISAMEYSGNAVKLLKAAGCKILTLEEILKQKDVRVIV